MNQIYLDHAATTPVRPEVLDAMMPYFSEEFGNPSSPYGRGRRASDALEESREKVAQVLNCRPSEVTFTSGGTESDNAAIKGVALAAPPDRRHIITTQIEHHAVLHAADQMELLGCSVTKVPVDSDGLVDPKSVESALSESTCLVSVMYANNEVGVVQDIATISSVVRRFAETNGIQTYMHTDAVQAPGQLSLDVDDLGVDLMSLSGHKFYGPKGVGVLYIRRGTQLFPLLSGGGQELDRRSGTQNVAGIVGLASALELAELEREETMIRLTRLRDRLIEGIYERIPNGRLNGHRTQRLANNVNFSFERTDGEALVIRLDMKGIQTSTGSACSSASIEPSHVLLALGLDRQAAVGSLRLSLGSQTSENDVEQVLGALYRLTTEQANDE